MKNTESFWDYRLKRSPENLWPLAPKDWVKAGARGGEMKYFLECQWFGQFCREGMLKRIRRLPRGWIQYLGIGSFRDGLWVLPAARMGFTMNLLDICGIACRNARDFLDNKPFSCQVNISKREVMNAWQSGQINEGQTVAYYASQFIQVQERPVMQQMMRRLGLFVGQSRERVVYLVHPFGEDNPANKVKWGATTPYTARDLKAPFEEGLYGRARMEVVSCHMHFHQMYKLVELGRAV